MTKRITVSLTDAEYAQLQQVAKAADWCIATFAANAVVGAVEAELEAQASEADLQRDLNEWALRMAPVVGNA